MTKYFVWIKDTHSSPTPQIWHGEQKDGNGKPKPTLFIKELPMIEESLSVATLAQMYPCEDDNKAKP